MREELCGWDLLLNRSTSDCSPLPPGSWGTGITAASVVQDPLSGVCTGCLAPCCWRQTTGLIQHGNSCALMLDEVAEDLALSNRPMA